MEGKISQLLSVNLCHHDSAYWWSATSSTTVFKDMKAFCPQALHVFLLIGYYFDIGSCRNPDYGLYSVFWDMRFSGPIWWVIKYSKLLAQRAREKKKNNSSRILFWGGINIKTCMLFVIDYANYRRQSQRKDITVSFLIKEKADFRFPAWSSFFNFTGSIAGKNHFLTFLPVQGVWG